MAKKKKPPTFAQWDKVRINFLMNHSMYCDKCGGELRIQNATVVHDPKPDYQQIDDPDFMLNPANLRVYCDACYHEYYDIGREGNANG